MKKRMTIFLYIVSIIWAIVGFLILLGAWNENESDYESITGKVSQALDLDYDIHTEFSKPAVVMAKISLEGDQKEYRVRGKLYHLNREGMESIQEGETLRLLVKKSSIVGGFPINSSSKSAPVSGIYRTNGEVIIPLEKGIAHAKVRLRIGLGLIGMGLALAVWTYWKNQ